MRPIPIKQREKMSKNPYYKKCCLCGETQGKIDYHHNVIFGGRQANDEECILPLCLICHDGARNSKVKEKLDLIMYRRMSDATFMKYDKTGMHSTRYHYLENKYGDRIFGTYQERQG
jgi:hypothetical protein